MEKLNTEWIKKIERADRLEKLLAQLNDKQFRIRSHSGGLDLWNYFKEKALYLKSIDEVSAPVIDETIREIKEIKEAFYPADYPAAEVVYNIISWLFDNMIQWAGIHAMSEKDREICNEATLVIIELFERLGKVSETD